VTAARSTRLVFGLALGAWLGGALLGESPLSAWHLGASALLALILAGRPGELPEPSAAACRAIFVGLFLWSALAWALLGWVHSNGLVFALTDVGIYANLVAQLALHGAYYSHLLGVHGLADHFAPGLMLFAPLFRLEPNVLWFYAANSVAVLASALILRRLCVRVLATPGPAAWLLPCLWLLHCAVNYGYFWQFQPSQLSPPLILAAFLFAVEGRTLPMLLVLALLASLKENMPLAVISVGVFQWVMLGRRRLGASLALAAIGYGVLVVFIAMPWFAEGGVVTAHTRFDPLALLPQKLWFFAVCLASVGFLPLLRPRILLFVLPAFAVHAVSGFPNMFWFRYHYTAMPIAVVFAAAVFGLQALREAGGLGALTRAKPWRRVLALGMVATLFTLNGVTPLRAIRVRWPSPEIRAASETLWKLGCQVEGYEVVYTTHTAGAYFIDQPRLKIASERSLPRILAETRPHAVVLETVTPGWLRPPISDFRPLQAALDEAARAGRYERVEPGPGAALYLYRAPRNPSGPP
jgi:uncharacterized membrane protein